MTLAIVAVVALVLGTCVGYSAGRAVEQERGMRAMHTMISRLTPATLVRFAEETQDPWDVARYQLGMDESGRLVR